MAHGNGVVNETIELSRLRPGDTYTGSGYTPDILSLYVQNYHTASIDFHGSTLLREIY